MDINDMDQGLLTRNPSMTREEFSEHWYTKHAPLVIPMFLYLGVQHYQQIHPPFTPLTPNPNPNLDLLSFDGIAGLPSPSALSAIASGAGMAKWVQAYYDEVVKVDERRFLVSEALEHIVRMPPRTVQGTVRVVIQEGKALVEVPERVWALWREYEARGRREEEGEGKGGEERGERRGEGV